METGQALDQQSRPRVCAKKKRRDKLISLLAKHPEWQLAFQDEVWWSRLSQPHLCAWTGNGSQAKPLPLVEKEAAKTDTDPKAIACYGAMLADTGQEKQGQMLLRFVQGRPISQVTCDFLGWLAQKMVQADKQGLVLIWDNASWHVSKIVKNWLKAHNRHVKKEGGCRLVVCFLPSKSPWLNAIEPKWVHGKRAIVEPVRTLAAMELMERICAYYGCEHEPHLIQHIAQQVC